MNMLLSGRRILVVEDEMMVLMMIEGMLAELGCGSVTAAATVCKALALIDNQAFDVAMLDLNLGGDRSLAVADALDERSVPFLFSTGYGDLGVTEKYRDRPVLKKPFGFGDLRRAFEIFPLGDLPAAA